MSYGHNLNKYKSRFTRGIIEKKSRGRFASKKIIEVNSFLGPGRFALSLVRLKLYGSLLATEAP